jgi:period circadian protein 2
MTTLLTLPRFCLSANDEVFVLPRDDTKFTTRHTASGILSHVDGTANLLGFLPQDMLGRKIMEFYHPEDMTLLKDVYGTIMLMGEQTAGSSFCGKPYRFLAHNGCYITVETEWSSFVNPWSHHLEFVIGYHRVLKGPSNPNVLAPSELETVQFSETVVNESKRIQEEILKMLTEPVARPSATIKQQVSERCQVLQSFMETLMDEVYKPGLKDDLKLDLPQEPDLTFSERDSVMFGEISPHHDYYDSKSSSETPPSYKQLNYSENLQRFFDSRPVTTIAELEQMKMEQNYNDPCSRINSSPTQCFGESAGSESAGNMSSASNVNMESVTNTSTGNSNGSYIPPTLTEALLCKHNDDMEKLIIKRHKVSRTTGKSDKKQKGAEKVEYPSHGVKRSGSLSWEGEAHKTLKHQHIVEVQKTTPAPFVNQLPPRPYKTANVDLWPPFSVSLTSLQSTQTTTQATPFATSNIFPTLYYIPQNVQDQRQITTYQYMPSVLYQPMVYSHPSSFYQVQFPANHSNDQMFNQNFQFDKNVTVPQLQKIPTPIGSGSLHPSTPFARPPSQATSVKADMGSTSASIVNRV